jgi:hypothetical protein
LKKKYEPDDDWFKSKGEAWAAWEKAQKPEKPQKSREDREAAFVEAMRLGMEPKDAAIEAGYSPNAAAMTAGRLLNKSGIMEAISE